MQFRSVAAAAVAATFIFSPVAGATDAAPLPCASTSPATVCAAAPREQFKPESHLRSVVENFLRYRITRVGVDGGCYVVQASDRNGTPFEVKFRGNDLKMVSRYVAKDEPLNAPSSTR